jgi:hypothetical protein
MAFKPIRTHVCAFDWVTIRKEIHACTSSLPRSPTQLYRAPMPVCLATPTHACLATLTHVSPHQCLPRHSNTCFPTPTHQRLPRHTCACITTPTPALPRHTYACLLASPHQRLPCLLRQPNAYLTTQMPASPHQHLPACLTTSTPTGIWEHHRPLRICEHHGGSREGEQVFIRAHL